MPAQASARLRRRLEFLGRLIPLAPPCTARSPGARHRPGLPSLPSGTGWERSQVSANKHRRPELAASLRTIAPTTATKDDDRTSIRRPPGRGDGGCRCGTPHASARSRKQGSVAAVSAAAASGVAAVRGPGAAGVLDQRPVGGDDEPHAARALAVDIAGARVARELVEGPLAPHLELLLAAL